MKIKGHSGFLIKIIKYNNIIVISKQGENKNKERLKQQIIKQDNFYKNYMEFFKTKTPKILLYGEKEFLMEYIYFSENILDYIQLGNVNKLDLLINKLIEIIENYIRLCKIERINANILLQKIKSIEENIINNSNVNEEDIFIKNNIKYLYDNYQNISNLYLPCGICHGDLTLSNILINLDDMSFYLIDFLDTFIESPLLDIIKIRQDTKYNWISKMYCDKFDKNKCLITLNYMDKKIDKYFSKYEFYNKGYLFYDKLNILRIIQYSTDSENLVYFKKYI